MKYLTIKLYNQDQHDGVYMWLIFFFNINIELC